MSEEAALRFSLGRATRDNTLVLIRFVEGYLLNIRPSTGANVKLSNQV